MKKTTHNKSTTHTATAQAPANIAFIKYWGNKNTALRIPYHNSISMNLSSAVTITTVSFSEHFAEDEVLLGNTKLTGAKKDRVIHVLDAIRRTAKKHKLPTANLKAQVTTKNSFPTAAGMASSASGFAALALAGTKAAGLSLSTKELSTFARLGSGSATRSIPNGFVEWIAGDSHETSYAKSIHNSDHWKLVDLIAVVDSSEKKVSSTLGHSLAQTSPLFDGRVETMPKKIKKLKQALKNKNLQELGTIIEEESFNLHAVMMTSQPSVLYWTPTTVRVLQTLRTWREQGLLGYATMDAGPNVHIICEEKSHNAIKKKLAQLAGVQEIIVGKVALGAELIK